MPYRQGDKEKNTTYFCEIIPEKKLLKKAALEDFTLCTTVPFANIAIFPKEKTLHSHVP